VKETLTKAQTTYVEPIEHLGPPGRSYTDFDYLTGIHRSLQRLGERINILEYRRWSTKELGVGLTPLIEIPEDINSYARENIRILYKPEYLNAGGSGKARAVSFMLYYYRELGLLDGIKRVTTAGFGNFVRSLVGLLPSVKPGIAPVAYMANVLVDENQDLVNYLASKGAVINGCADNRCPTGNMEKGKAIASAYIEAETDLENSTLFLDQHGVFKPFDGFLNAAGYYYSLAPEILHQAEAEELPDLYYVNGEGTRGSLLGVGAALQERARTKIVALRQEEGGHLFGLRSLTELGKSDSLGQVESLCSNVYEISDKEAFSTMNQLWEAGIPATPSGGSYVAGALRKAEELRRYKKEGTIVTLIFDSIDFYRNILDIWMPRILGRPLDLGNFEALRSKAWTQRKEHISRLMAGKNELFNAMMISSDTITEI
jgi:cysteine synthase